MAQCTITIDFLKKMQGGGEGRSLYEQLCDMTGTSGDKTPMLVSKPFWQRVLKGLALEAGWAVASSIYDLRVITGLEWT